MDIDLEDPSTPFHLAEEHLSGLTTEEFWRFCNEPQRRWNGVAREVVQRVIQQRTDSPQALEELPVPEDDSRFGELALFYGARLGDTLPATWLHRIDFDDAYREKPLQAAMERMLEKLETETLKRLRDENPKQRITLFRFAYDEQLFRTLLRDPEWKGYVGDAGADALPAITASLREDGHVQVRRRHAIHSIINILQRSVGPFDEVEAQAWREMTEAWHALLDETSMVLELPAQLDALLKRLPLEEATAWTADWSHSGRLELATHITLFPFLDEEGQWRTVDDLAKQKRRSTETGELRRIWLQLPTPMAHAARMARAHDASPKVLKLLRDIFKHRRHLATFNAQLEQDS